jgi:hypothetical protein
VRSTGCDGTGSDGGDFGAVGSVLVEAAQTQRSKGRTRGSHPGVGAHRREHEPNAGTTGATGGVALPLHSPGPARHSGLGRGSSPRLALALVQGRGRVEVVAASQMLAHVDYRHLLAEALDEAQHVERLAVLAAPAYRDERHLFGSRVGRARGRRGGFLDLLFEVWSA